MNAVRELTVEGFDLGAARLKIARAKLNARLDQEFEDGNFSGVTAFAAAIDILDEETALAGAQRQILLGTPPRF